MLDRPATLQFELEQLYDRTDPDVDLARFVADHAVADDDALAELIEMDGRMRIARGRAVELDRYLHAVNDLTRRDVPLDAAIDVTLRAMSRSGRADEASVLTLIDRYPALEGAIRDAGVLSEALISTAGLRADMDEQESRPLPGDFGPRLDDGRARYELRELLGAGAFGQVYLAVDRQLSEPGHAALVAIKILTTRVRTPWVRERLADEATKARRVDHPNVVRVVDRGVTMDDEDYIVHEYVSGGDLSAWMGQQDGPIPPRQAAALVARIARGVQAAHSAGLVHCDLKPGNIMLTPAGEPKVTDFGIAARLDEPSAVAPETGDDDRPIGNLAFIAPEQYRREDGATNIPADVYALGGILFRLLSGRLPNGSTVEEIARTHDPEHGRRRPPRPGDHARGVDRDLNLICQRALAVSPEDRYSSAAALADDLESWLRREPLPWTKPSTLRITKLWMRRKPGLAVACGLLLLLVLAAEMTVRHYLREADLARLAQLEAEQLEAVFKAAGVEISRRMRGYVAEGDRPSTEILAGVWFMEDVLGTKIFGPPGRRTDAWLARVEAARQELDLARAHGRENDLEVRFMEAQLALWLVDDGDWVEAEPMLASNRDYWRSILADDDWLDVVDALHAAAVVNRLAAEAKQDGFTPERRAEAVEVEARFAAHRALFERILPGSPIHHVVLRSLASLYGPDLLNRPHDVERLEAEVNHLLKLDTSDRSNAAAASTPAAGDEAD
jgi:serine/threonine protein kinase